MPDPAGCVPADVVGVAITGAHGEEILAQENILKTVAIEVGDVHGKGRGDLGFVRKFHGFEVIGAIKEDGGGEGGGFDLGGGFG